MRIAAVAVLVGLVLSILFPQVLNPAWTEGTPPDQVPFAYGFVALALALVWCALRSRIEVGADEILIVNPWGTTKLAKADVVEVRPGEFGVEFLAGKQRVVGFAVQTTHIFVGDRPRWVDIAELVTGVAPDWDDIDDDEE